MFTYTETPIRDIWEHLKFLAVEHNCKGLLSGKIKSGRKLIYSDSNVVNRKAKEISMCIRQAFEYFQAAEQATINTSPLILFYGMLSLSKALIVANSEDIYLRDIKYHGLTDRPKHSSLKDYQDKEESWQMENEYAVTDAGVFGHLTKILDGFDFPKYSVIEYKEILKCIPELYGMFKKYYNEDTNILPLYTHAEETTPSYSLTLTIYKSATNMFEIIPELKTEFTLEDQELHGV